MKSPLCLLAAVLGASLIPTVFAVGEIEPYHAKEIEPFHAQTLGSEPLPAEPALPAPSTAVTATAPAPGLADQPAANPGKKRPVRPAALAMEPRLAGVWRLEVPGANTTKDGASGGATLGVLQLDSAGNYRWAKNGEVFAGRAARYAPRRDATPGQSYFLIRDGRDAFYVSFETYKGESYLQLKQAATDSVVGYGAPAES
jgi:hypothetical protein